MERRDRAKNGQQARAIFNHVNQRARERYGREVSGRDLSEMKRSICGGRARYLHPSHNNTDVYEVPYAGLRWRVAYSPQLDLILTFLPPLELTHAQQVWSACRRIIPGRGQ